MQHSRKRFCLGYIGYIGYIISIFCLRFSIQNIKIDFYSTNPLPCGVPLIEAMITPGDVASVSYNKLEESVTIQITRFLTLPLRLATKAVECKIRYSKDNFSPP